MSIWRKLKRLFGKRQTNTHANDAPFSIVFSGLGDISLPSDPVLYNELIWIANEEGITPEEALAMILTTAINEYQIQKEQINSLTVREYEVVVLLCQGITNQKIAEQLLISLDTVRSHLRRIFPKFGVRNKEELQVYLRNWRF